MSNEKVKKILGITSKVISWVIIALTAFMMIFTVFSTLTFDRNDRNLFGIRFYVVLTDSMSPSEKNKDDAVHFNAGDIVLIRNVDAKEELKEGDVIAFISQNDDSVGETITHKIHSVRREGDKLLGYVTYGTNTGTLDKALVEPEYVLGAYTGKLPGVGNFFSFLKTTPGYIICILIPFILLILWYGAGTVRLFRQYKKEQMADMEAERAQLAKEREQSAEMMRELIALREQLSKQNGEGENPAEQEQNGEGENPAEQEQNGEDENPAEQTSEDTAESGSDEHTKGII